MIDRMDSLQVSVSFFNQLLGCTLQAALESNFK